MDAPPLATLAATWRFASGFAVRAVEGFSAADWERRVDQGNPARWIIGHLAGARRSALTVAGAPRPAADWEPRYHRGTLPNDLGGSDGAALFADFVASGEALFALLPTLTSEQCAASVPVTMPDGSQTRGAVLQFLHFHESYHLGQIGLLRRLVGRPRVA